MGISQVELQYLVHRYTCSDMLLTYASAQSINGITLKTPLEKIKLGNLDEKGTFLGVGRLRPANASKTFGNLRVA